MNMSIGSSIPAQISQSRAQMQSTTEMAAMSAAALPTEDAGALAISEVEKRDDADQLSERLSSVDLDSEGLFQNDRPTETKGDRPPPPPPRPADGSETSTMNAESLVMSLIETDEDETAVDFTSYTAATDIENAYSLTKDLLTA